MTRTTIAVANGGGDAPGLNAVIRAIVLSASHRGWRVFGVERGLDGLLDTQGLRVLVPRDVRGILERGGTVLGTTNKGNPFEYPVVRAGEQITVDRSDEVVATFREGGFDALVMIGGDGTLGIAARLAAKGLPIVGVPKTIDNDVAGTWVTFGFDTAVSVATAALGRLHTTAESHRRVMVLEVMGRYAGWIALHAGISGGADVILLPEVPFSWASVEAKLEQRYAAGGRDFAIVVAAEGAYPRDGALITRGGKVPGSEVTLGGVGQIVCNEIQQRTGHESRCVVLGHLQRGGTPTTFDRLLGSRFGAQAVRLIEQRRFGRCVVFRPPSMEDVPLSDVMGQIRGVDMDSDTVATARDLGICLGD